MERLTYLVDTNIFLEGLLDQLKAGDVEAFFRSHNLGKLAVTDLSVHSIGIILFRLKEYRLFTDFIDDMIVGGMKVLSLGPGEMKAMERSAKKFGLDFDDAYQYTVAKNHNLELVSFDKDFERTDLKHKEPSEALQ
jgi:uncharacterized protein